MNVSIHANFLDRHSRMSSPLHRLPAWMKLLAAVTLVLCVVLLPARLAAWLAMPAAMLVALAALSRIPLAFLIKRLALLEAFVAGVAVLAVFQPDGPRIAALLVARCTLCMAAMILLSNTTPFAELLRVLRRLRIPALMITTLALMYRYLFVLADESQRMRRARQSRTFAPSRRRQWRTMATVVGQLFIRASERAERIYSAMCARGWR